MLFDEVFFYIYNIYKCSVACTEPYPPMPKSDIAKKGKIPLPQEVYGSSDEEDSSILSPRKRLKIVTEGSVEWEKVSRYLIAVYKKFEFKKIQLLQHLRTFQM